MFTKSSMFVLLFSVSFALLAALCSSASAAAIAVGDGDFELQSTGIPSAPWVEESAFTWVDSMPNGSVPDNGGSRFLWMNAVGGVPANGQGKISQLLSANYEAGTYTLSVDMIVPWTSSGVTMELRDAVNSNAVLASQGFSSSEDTSWINYQLPFTVQPTDSFVGNAIDIAFAHTGDASIGIDNVVLGFTPIPEPGVIVLLATGLLGLLAYAWRKHK